MYVLRIEIEIPDAVDDADARQKALKALESCGMLGRHDEIECLMRCYEMKLQRRYEDRPPRAVRFP